MQLCSRSGPVPPVVGLMYTLAHYKMLRLKSVPPVVSKTSKPQVNFSIKLFR